MSPLADARSIQSAAILLGGGVLLTLYARNLGGELGDIDAYYAAAWAARLGNPLYEHAFAWREAGFAVSFPGPPPVTEHFGGGNSSPFVYPAAFALAFAPLTVLPLEAVRIVWFTLVFGAFIAAAGVLSSIFFCVRRAYRLPVWLGLAAGLVLLQPTRASFASGQVDAVLLLLVALSLRSFLRGQDARAGVLLALAAAVKPFLGFLLLYYLWKRAVRTTLAFVGVSAALLLLPTLYFGPSILTDFAAVALYWSSPSFAVSPFNQSLYGLSLRLFTVNAFTVPIIEAPGIATAIRVVLAATVLLVLVWAVSRSRSLPRRYLGLEFGLVVVGMLLVAPLAQDIYYIHLAIPLVAAASTLWSAWSWRASTVALAVALAVVCLYLSLPSLRAVSMGFYAFHEAPLTGLRVWQTGTHAYGLVLVAAVMLATLVWRRQLQADTARAVSATTEDRQPAAASVGPAVGSAIPTNVTAFTRPTWSAHE